MMSFDSESSLCGRELTFHMQAPIDRYMKDEDSRRSEDAMEIARVERQVMTKVEFEIFRGCQEKSQT